MTAELAAGGLFISCGELSGDGYASAVVRTLRSKGVGGRIFGMGGTRSAAAGVEILWDSRMLHLMGIGEVLPSIPRLLRLKSRMIDTVMFSGVPTVLVIDSPDFHLPFVASLRARGWRGRVVYAVPPTVWAWRSGRVKALARDVDLCLPLFRFEHEFLQAHGVVSAWRGHPLADDFASVAPSFPPLEARRIALLPGSRRSEIRRLLPTLRGSASQLRAEGFSPVFSVAPGLSDDLKEWMKRELRGMEIFEGEGRELLSGSAAAAGASGTVAVEAMLLDRFMVVLYKTGFLSECVWRMLAKTERISLPNILAGRDVYPELLQRHATPKNAMEALLRYLRDPEYRDAVHSGLRIAREGMGEPGALAFWAESILSGEVETRRPERQRTEETSP